MGCDRIPSPRGSWRPSFTPRAFARARPSPVRARISSRSNSARPRLSPTDPRLFIWLPALAGAHYLLRHYEEAIEAGRRFWSLYRA
jgi:hypothetical protein